MTIHQGIVLLTCLATLVAGTGDDLNAAGQEAVVEAPEVEAPAPYAYQGQGRRDPFVSLLARGKDPTAASSRPPGVTGVLIGEVTVRGIVHDRSGFIAMIQAPDRKTYIVRSGEKLMDGSIKAITSDAIVFSQDVTDPLATVKQKEVRKSVRPAESGE